MSSVGMGYLTVLSRMVKPRPADQTAPAAEHPTNDTRRLGNDRGRQPSSLSAHSVFLVRRHKGTYLLVLRPRERQRCDNDAVIECRRPIPSDSRASVDQKYSPASRVSSSRELWRTSPEEKGSQGVYPIRYFDLRLCGWEVGGDMSTTKHTQAFFPGEIS